MVTYLQAAAPVATRIPVHVPRAAPELTVQGIFMAQPNEAFGANELLFSEGDPARYVYEVVEGVVRLCRLMSDGRRAITGFVFPGDILGISFNELHPYTAEAVTKVKVRRHLRSRFQQMVAERPALSREVFAMVSDELSAAQDQMLLLGRKTAQERVASFLLTVISKLRGSRKVNEITLPLTRQDMADHLGLTIETVSRTMSKLKKDGAISLPDPQRVVIEDRELLRELAGDAEPDLPGSLRVQIHRQAAWPS